MNIPRHLSTVFLLVFSLFAAKSVDDSRQACSSFRFSTEFNKEPNQEFYTLTISASGGRTPYQYLLLNEKNLLVSTEYSKNVFADLKPGRYRCIVADKDDCTQEKFIDVK